MPKELAALVKPFQNYVFTHRVATTLVGSLLVALPVVYKVWQNFQALKADRNKLSEQFEIKDAENQRLNQRLALVERENSSLQQSVRSLNQKLQNLVFLQIRTFCKLKGAQERETQYRNRCVEVAAALSELQADNHGLAPIPETNHQSELISLRRKIADLQIINSNLCRKSLIFMCLIQERLQASWAEIVSLPRSKL
jgi:hypothetical protein